MYELFKKIGVDARPGWTGNKKVTCPKCQDQRSAKNKNDKPLSINMDNGTYNCHHCGWKGVVHEEVKYDRPKKEIYELLPEVEQWIVNRQISLDAAKLAKVGASNIHGKTCVLFNYYNLHGSHCNVKARDINDKKYQRQSTNAEKTPYGAQHINNAPFLLITEGEPDVLSWYTAGILYAISGPNGSSDDKWIELIYDKIEDIEKIYIAVDNDEAGKKYEKNLVRRFDKSKLYKIDYGSYNDANDILIQNGQQEGIEILKHIFNNAEPYPIDEIDRVSKHMEKALSFFINGYPDTYKTGVDDLDSLFTLYLEDVTVVTGTPNAGKSNFVDWLVTVHAKRHGLKAGVFTGEKTIDIHLAGLVYKWLEKSREEMNPEKDGITFMEAMAGLHDYIFYFSESIRTFDELLDYGKVMVKRYGIDILVLDNWTVIDKSVPNLTDSKDYYGTILGKLSHFAKKNKCHVFLVVHPRKLEEINGLYKMPRGYDLYGTSHFFNIPDNGISLRAGDGYTDILVWKVRHQEFVGNPGSGKLKFLERQGRIYDNFVSPNRFKLEIEQNIIDDAPF